jgi:hypothetical protein
MSSKAHSDRALELLLDAISSLNFEKIPPLPLRGALYHVTILQRSALSMESLVK